MNISFNGRKKQIELREYTTLDCKEVVDLFYHTVHTVNAQDYTQEELDAWATGQENFEEWDKSLREHYSIVAIDNEMIVGFGDIDRNGYLDRLFVHSDYQRMGIATAICNRLEEVVNNNIITRASVTAVPFFEKRNYKVVKKQEIVRHGVLLESFLMEKG